MTETGRYLSQQPHHHSRSSDPPAVFCAGPSGPTGSTGDKGDTGPSGPTGSTGEDSHPYGSALVTTFRTDTGAECSLVGRAHTRMDIFLAINANVGPQLHLRTPG